MPYDMMYMDINRALDSYTNARLHIHPLPQGKSVSQRVGRVLKRGEPARSVSGRDKFCAVPKGYDLDYILRHQKVKRERKSPGRR